MRLRTQDYPVKSICEVLGLPRSSFYHQIERLDQTVQAAKSRLLVLLTQGGENWTDDDGYARLTRDSVRTAYEAAALDRLMLNSPWWHKRLRNYRREFAVRGGVQVK